MITLYRDYPEYVPVKLELDGADYRGAYSLAFTVETAVEPAVDTWTVGPVLSSSVPAGTWMAWAKVDDNPEHPIIKLGRITVR